MNWLRTNWPSFDNNWTLPFGTLTDLVGLAVGLIGLLVAWRVYRFTKKIGLRQLEIMDDQTAMMKRQDDANERMEKLTIEQAAIAKRQGEIAEAQHSMLLSQAASRPEFLVTAHGPLHEDEHTNDFSLYIYCENVGRKAAEALTSVVALGGDGHRGETNIVGPGNEVAHGGSIDDQFYMLASIEEPQRLFPSQRVLLARVLVKHGPRPLRFHVLWKLHCSDGTYPDNSYGRLDFTRGVEGEPINPQATFARLAERGAAANNRPVDK